MVEVSGLFLSYVEQRENGFLLAAPGVLDLYDDRQFSRTTVYSWV